jgi:hypothetical protein
MEARSMTSITARPATGARTGGRWALVLVGAPTVGAVVMFVVGALVQQIVAGEHGQFHALFASVFLAPALLLAVRRPNGGAIVTPAIIGLTAAAISQLVEGVGGFGYGPGNEARVNALAQVHDLGVMLAPLGLVAAALGVTVAVAQLIRPRLGPWAALVVAALVMAGLGFVIAKMIGM